MADALRRCSDQPRGAPSIQAALSTLCCPHVCRQCSQVSAKYQECKATCNGCEHLRAAIQADTGLQVRVVQQLGACQDLHTSCSAWQAAGKCEKEPKAMLELCQVGGWCETLSRAQLCSSLGRPNAAASRLKLLTQAVCWSVACAQASCGFCLPQAALTEAGGSSSSGQPAGLLDDCQDDINVCPYLAAVGLCTSSSLWVETQCRRSCRQCTAGGV